MWKKAFLLCLSINTLLFGRELLPPFPDRLSVEPRIPESFVMGPDPDLYSGVVWGEKEAIKRLCMTHKIDDVFFFVRLSGDIIQQDQTTFQNEESLYDRFRLMGCTKIDIYKKYWEKHPVLVASCIDSDGRAGYRAWIGLNSCVGGWVLSVTFHYPESQTAPTPEQLAIWTNFLESASL
ncbi:MAG: hypothetical protein JJU12_00925 [Chlamydiales bacterium]|nr:hypothetical protein [Chlamydiales bacterium]